MNHIVVIDGYGFVFRAFHSLPPLTRKDGVVVGAVFGFCSMLMRLLTEIHATHICIVFDSGKRNFRHELYSEYKANRPEAPQELKEQFPLVRQAAKAFNIVSIEKDGFEADDIIATIADTASREDFKVTIVSSDKDLMQLIGDNVVMFDPMKFKVIDREAVLEKFGVYPEKVRDLLSLLGDSSDNIPGVKGIGAKGAADLLNEFGSLEDLLNKAENIKQNRYKNAILANAENAKLSYELVGLDKRVVLPCTLDELKIKEIDANELNYFFEKNQFRQLQKKMESMFDGIKKRDANNSVISTKHFIDKASFRKMEPKKFFEEALKNNALSIIKFDSKTFLALESGYYTIIETMSDYDTYITEIFANPSIIKIFYNAKPFFKSYHINHFEDVQLMAYVADSSQNFENISNAISVFLENSDNDPQQYCFKLFSLYGVIQKKIIEDQVFKIYSDFEKPLIKILADMEKAGILISKQKIIELKEEFQSSLRSLEKEIYKEAGVSFNIGSTKQLGEVLFERLSLPASKKGKSGSYSTDIDVLEELSIQGFTIADKLIEWRHLSKLISTYTDPLINATVYDGRIHSTFSQINTITGRLSSSNPNLQNIPIRTAHGVKIREAFIAKPGHKLISFDYSQIELRILAHIANVKELINAFHHNKDIHKITASQVFGIEEDKVDDSLRRKAKAVNFGIIYGISAFGLAKQIGVSRSDAKIIIDKYLETYNGIKKFMDEAQENARKYGFVETLFGRKCYVKDIMSSNFAARGFAERLAINAPIQGTAADIIKLAMIKIANSNIPDTTLILQIHDELIFETPENGFDEKVKKIQNIMQNVVTLNVPLTVNYGIGDNWGEI